MPSPTMASQTTYHHRGEPRLPSSQPSLNENGPPTKQGGKEQPSLSPQQIHAELKQREDEISRVKAMILWLRNEQKNVEDIKDIKRLCELIDQRNKLKDHADELQEHCSALRWYAIGTQSTVTFDVAMTRLLKIQQETGNSTAALSAFGAALSMSILFSANRGDMWWFFEAWWCFTFGVVTLGALQILTTGAGSNTSLATPGNWRARRAALLVITVSYTGVALGLGCFATAVINYDVSREILGGDPQIDGGPRPSKGGHKLPTTGSKIGYAFTAFFFCLFIGAFVYRIAPRLQLRNRHRGVQHSGYFVRNDQNKSGRFEAMLSGTEDA